MKKILLTATVLIAGAAPLMADDWDDSYIGGSLNTGGDTASAFVGHHYDLGYVVVGAELGATRNFTTRANTATVEGIVGADLGNFMPYVSGGWSLNGTQTYGAGLNYQLGRSVILGAKWSKTSTANQVSGRISFNF